MNKAQLVCLLIAVVCCLSVLIPHVSEEIFGPKICKTEYCMNEAIGGKYCSAHQCVNFSCHNKRADGFSYCKSCLKKAGYDID